ncbi:MAG: hypothetical protein HRU19_18425 [Pseudobacteriovorax sp.]|nr:hypothetical protein [Pseudobacteriovorax sp.]
MVTKSSNVVRHLPLIAAGILSLSLSCGKKDRPDEPTNSELTCSTPSTFYEARTTLKSFSDETSWEDVINQCILFQGENYCNYATLPLISTDASPITRADVLDRTVATHRWMKERFSQMLDSYPDELVQMFRHVTAVVISKDARPSHYWTAHGAIILDPSGFWLTEDERATLSDLEDCRSQNFRKDELSFRVYSFDFVDDTPTFRLERSLESLSLRIGMLLAHELAHAMDYTAALGGNNLDGSRTLFQLIQQQNTILSSTLTQESPHDSDLLDQAAKYFFAGAEASQELLNATPSSIARDFEAGAGLKLYSYFNSREDFANLIEAHIARKYWNVSQSVAIVEPIDAQSNSCADRRLKWTQMNRELSPQILARINRGLELSSVTVEATSLIDSNPELGLLGYEPDTASEDFCDYLGFVE